MERIDTGLLIPGRGEPVRDATILIDGPRISYAGPAAGAPETPGVRHPHRGHRDAGDVGLPRSLHGQPGDGPGPAAAGAGGAARGPQSARDLANTLDAGITSVREVGGLGVYLAQAVREGLLDGPTIYPAGAVLSTTGGHGDLHCYPLSWVEDFGHYDGTFRLADGPSECCARSASSCAGARP